MLHKVFITIGNHDFDYKRSHEYWQDAFIMPDNGPVDYKESVYSFDYGNSHFVVLNSEKPEEHIINKVQNKIKTKLYETDGELIEIYEF